MQGGSIPASHSKSSRMCYNSTANTQHNLAQAIQTMVDLALRTQHHQDADKPHCYAVVADELRAVQEIVLTQIRSCEPLIEEIGTYVLDSPGKRIRPLLTLLAAKHAGCHGEAQLHLSAAIECLHTATLLHDDVIDESRLRRGRLAAHQKWGNSPSVLVGDYLHARAFHLLVGIGDIQVLQVMAKATRTVVEGEIMQLASVGDIHLTEQRYREIICSKTATLFQACTQSAGALAGAPVETQAALSAFGLHLGTAYQLVDDILDYAGETEEIGKNVGDDLTENKITLPFIHAYARANDEQQAVMRRSLCNHALFGEVLAIIHKTGALKSAQQAVLVELKKMQTCLDRLDATPYKDAMEELAYRIVHRKH